MNKDKAIVIAKLYALNAGVSGEHTYLPNTKESLDDWMPHDWVIEAIQHAAVKQKPKLLDQLLAAFDAKIESEKENRSLCRQGTESFYTADGRVDGVDAGRYLVEYIFSQQDKVDTDEHPANISEATDLQEPLDIDDLIIALEHSVTEMDHVDTSSLQYQAAKKLRDLTKAFEDGYELAQYASYAEIVGGITSNRQPIREFCDKVYEHNRRLNQAQTDEA